MKKVTNDVNTVHIDDVEQGYIYLVVDHRDGEVGIVVHWDAGDFAITRLEAKELPVDQDNFDELAINSLPRLLDAALDMGYEVYQFDGHEEMARWICNNTSIFRRTETKIERKEAAKKFAMLYPYLNSRKTTHVINSIEIVGKEIVVTACCGQVGYFDANLVREGRLSEVHNPYKWHLSKTSPAAAFGRHNCSNCEKVSDFPGWSDTQFILDQIEE